MLVSVAESVDQQLNKQSDCTLAEACMFRPEEAVNMLSLMFMQTLNFLIMLIAIISKSVVHNYN
jgi:hypothetical protein